MMKPEIKKIWVEALRSGDYKQGKRYLRPGGKNEFCCLGVLCNLHAIAHPAIAARQKNPKTYMHSDAGLPIRVMEWSGLTHPLGDAITLDDARDNIAWFNDGAVGTGNYTFLDLATAIEKQL